MSIEEYIANLEKLSGVIGNDLTGYVIEPNATILLDRIKTRITEQGKNTNNADIGTYSVKPLYVSRDQFVKPGAFTPQGKNVNAGNRIVPTVLLQQSKKLALGHKFLPLVKQRKYKRYSVVKLNYETRKSMYLADGYKELRDIQGLRTDVVNFKYRGDLMRSYESQRIAYAVLLGLTTTESIQKRQNLEKKFGDVFHATEAEKQEYINAATYTLNRLTLNTLRGDATVTVR